MVQQYTYAKGVDGMTFYTKSTANVAVSYSADASAFKHGVTVSLDGSAEFFLAGIKISVSSPLSLSISLAGTINVDLKKNEVVTKGFYAETKTGEVDTGLSKTQAKTTELNDRLSKLSANAIQMGIEAVNLKKNTVSVTG